MKSKVRLAVLLLILALIMASGCARPETEEDAPDRGGESGDEIAGGNGGNVEEEISGDEAVRPGSGSGDSAAADPVGEVVQDSGTYLGQVDSHSIEIHICGVPLEAGCRVFQLSGRIRNEFAGYGFEKGDQVKFSYVAEDHSGTTTATIIKIEEIRN